MARSVEVTRHMLLIVIMSGGAVLAATSAAASCSCTGMTLVHSGTTGVMCSDNDLDFLKTECTKSEGSSQGCDTSFAYVCELGVNTQKLGNVKPYQKTGFMPQATLASESVLSDCTYGQVLQETITSGGEVETNPQIIPTSVAGAVDLAGHLIEVDNDAANAYPQSGASSEGRPLFGGDNYGDATANDVLFNVAPTSLSWWDNPDQSKDSQSEVATWTFNFLSFVNGSSGESSCACAFTIAVQWDGTDAPTTTWTQNPSLSTKCTF